MNFKIINTVENQRYKSFIPNFNVHDPNGPVAVKN